MSYDSSDPFDQATWWFMWLTCDDCGTMLEYQQSQFPDDSDEFYHEYAQRAKKSGWSVIPRDGESAAWDIFCPLCIAKHQVRT